MPQVFKAQVSCSRKTKKKEEESRERKRTKAKHGPDSKIKSEKRRETNLKKRREKRTWSKLKGTRIVETQDFTQLICLVLILHNKNVSKKNHAKRQKIPILHGATV